MEGEETIVICSYRLTLTDDKDVTTHLKSREQVDRLYPKIMRKKLFLPANQPIREVLANYL